MDRRDFLKTTSAAAVAAAAGAAASTSAIADISAPGIRADVRELRLATPWSTGVAGLADHARRLAQRIEAASDGRYRITVIASNGSGLDAVRRGDAELYFASEQDHTGSHRAFGYFAGLPGRHGLAAHDLEAWMLVGGGQMLWDDLAAGFGVKGFIAGHTGAEPPLWLKRQIGSLDDLRGQPIFAKGFARDVLTGLGALPAAMPADDVAAAFAGDALLGAEWAGLLASHARGLHRNAACYVPGGLSKHGTALSLGISRSLWDELAAHDQLMFAGVAAAEFHEAVASERAHAGVLAQTMAHAGGPALAAWPADVMTAMERVSSAVIAQAARSDAKAERISASYEAFKAALQANGAGFAAGWSGLKYS